MNVKEQLTASDIVGLLLTSTVSDDDFDELFVTRDAANIGSTISRMGLCVRWDFNDASYIGHRAVGFVGFVVLAFATVVFVIIILFQSVSNDRIVV